MESPSSDSRPVQPADPTFALKGEARQLRAEAHAQGQELSHAVALERVAQRRGFRDWNALSAHLAQGNCLDAPTPVSFAWQRLDEPLPTLPARLLQPSELRHRGTFTELMRWARQMEFIADKVAESDRRELVELIGERTPYVLERSLARWPDGLYRLCDRGYDVFKGLSISEDQVQALGLPAWNEAFGQHDGNGSYTVVGDGLRFARDVKMLKQMARLLASVAIEADRAGAAPRAVAGP